MLNTTIFNITIFTFSSIAIALKCYSHGDNHNIDHGEHAPPTDDQKQDCNERQDVCKKGWWIEDGHDPPITQTTRRCSKKKSLIEDGWQGSGCAKKYWEDGTEYNFCGCTTDYCNTSGIATPFHFLPLIALSFATLFFI